MKRAAQIGLRALPLAAHRKRHAFANVTAVFSAPFCEKRCQNSRITELLAINGCPSLAVGERAYRSLDHASCGSGQALTPYP